MKEKSGYEIERKFLIALPDEKMLSEKAVHKLEIVQTYLAASDGESARVRKTTENGKVTYTYTAKKRITAIKRIEEEREICEEEYKTFLLSADSSRRTIEKVRYCIPYAEHILEIDIFPFWRDKCFLEVELGDETENISLPPFITILKEVTEDRRYTNASLAIKLPE